MYNNFLHHKHCTFLLVLFFLMHSTLRVYLATQWPADDEAGGELGKVQVFWVSYLLQMTPKSQSQGCAEGKEMKLSLLLQSHLPYPGLQNRSRWCTTWLIPALSSWIRKWDVYAWRDFQASLQLTVELARSASLLLEQRSRLQQRNLCLPNQCCSGLYWRVL